MDVVLSLCLGIGLSAACGFRVFVPLLITSIAQRTGNLTLAPSFAWIGSNPALIAFSVATVMEIGAYYIPWLDHIMDAVATPAAVVAGIILTASIITGMSPMLKWTLAVIAGGTAAGSVQAVTVLARGLSLAGSGGLANPIVATAELGGAVGTSLLSLFAPVLVAILVLGGIIALPWLFVKYRRRSRVPGVVNEPAA